jgi:hypothetical protein
VGPEGELRAAHFDAAVVGAEAKGVEVVVHGVEVVDVA